MTFARAFMMTNRAMTNRKNRPIDSLFLELQKKCLANEASGSPHLGVLVKPISPQSTNRQIFYQYTEQLG